MLDQWDNGKNSSKLRSLLEVGFGCSSIKLIVTGILLEFDMDSLGAILSAVESRESINRLGKPTIRLIMPNNRYLGIG